MADPEFEALASTGMLSSLYARTKGAEIALYSKRGNRTFSDINNAANRVVRALRRVGLKAGDGIAVICPDTPEFVETFAAKQRGGFRWTPVNTHLSATEAAYIVENCEAKALFVHADLAGIAWPAACSPSLRIRLAIGGDIEGFERCQSVLGAEDPSDIDDPTPGESTMCFSSIRRCETSAPSARRTRNGVRKSGLLCRYAPYRRRQRVWPQTS